MLALFLTILTSTSTPTVETTINKPSIHMAATNSSKAKQERKHTISKKVTKSSFRKSHKRNKHKSLKHITK